jgi:formiminotetrahydrofolate cyclodeaminase
MDDAIWTVTLEQLSAQVARGPMPAAVSVTAICAVLALDLATMAIQVSARRARGGGHDQTIVERIGLARTRLQRAADQDISAYNDYLTQRRQAKSKPSAGAPQALEAALARAIEVPLDVAEAATQGLLLCSQATAFTHPVVGADLAAALLLLDAAVQAALRSADANLELADSQASMEALRGRRAVLTASARQARDVARNASLGAPRRPPSRS